MNKQKAALVLAHPGHELRIHGWLSSAKPDVFVLTDGSGQSGESRLSSTKQLIASMGIDQGPIFGRMTDNEFYQNAINGNTELFVQLAFELASHLVREQINIVVCDAAEGYSPTHDFVYSLTLSAVAIAESTSKASIKPYCFYLNKHPKSCSNEPDIKTLKIVLTDENFTNKISAIKQYSELTEESAKAIHDYGLASFRHEYLIPADEIDLFIPNDEAKPFYEVYGEKQVKSGQYLTVLRYKEHMLPIYQALSHCITEYA